MNKRVLSSVIGAPKGQIFIEENIHAMQKEHDKKQAEHLKKQNVLLKKQLQQLKSVYGETKKQLNLYRGMVNKKYVSKQDFDVQMSQIFQLQQKKIFDLQTELQILRNKYNKTVLSSVSAKETQYAVKCKQLQKRLQKCQSQYERQISYLKKKLMKSNASQLIMEKSKSSNFMSIASTQLQPLPGKYNKLDKLF